MSNVKNNEAWVVLADAKRARLIKVAPTPAGRVHVETAGELEDQWEGHEHGRPTMLSHRGPNTGSVAPNHDVDEELTRFARQIRQWAGTQMKDRSIERATLFAPARMLGALRSASGKHPALDLREGELMPLSNGDLAVHSMIVQLVSPKK